MTTPFDDTARLAAQKADGLSELIRLLAERIVKDHMREQAEAVAQQPTPKTMPKA
ncbi:MAG TPA: hypothetical protein VIQ01_07515 [Burkholderiales bacterium]|jgi:hypothetical protein